MRLQQSLVDVLKAHRLQITRAHLAGNFDVAFDLALYALGIELFRGFRYHTNPLEFRATEANPRSSLNDLAGTPADRLLQTHGCALDLDWLQLPPAQQVPPTSELPVLATSHSPVLASRPELRFSTDGVWCR